MTMSTTLKDKASQDSQLIFAKLNTENTYCHSRQHSKQGHIYETIHDKQSLLSSENSF